MRKRYRIAGLRRELERELKRVPGYEEYSEYLSMERGDRAVIGRHVNVGLDTPRPVKGVQNQIVQLFRKYFHSKARRWKLCRNPGYSWNGKVKSELVILLY